MFSELRFASAEPIPKSKRSQEPTVEPPLAERLPVADDLATEASDPELASLPMENRPDADLSDAEPGSGEHDPALNAPADAAMEAREPAPTTDSAVARLPSVPLPQAVNGDEAESATDAAASAVPAELPQEPVALLAPAAPRPVCYRVGVFSDAGNAEAAADRLTRSTLANSSENAVSAAVIPDEQRERSAVWIYLPPAESRSEAVGTMREMRAKGVKDLYVVNEGENKNAVSLGVYGHIPSLQRRVAALRELGYDPQTIERYRTIKVHWLEIRLERPTPLTASELEAQFPGATVESRACDGAF